MKKMLLIMAFVATCAIHGFDSVTGEPVIGGQSTHLEPGGGDDGPIPPPKPPCPGCPG